jgi:hypothetical protein
MNAILFAPPVLIVAMVSIILWFYKFLPPQVPLYYSRPWGQEQLASPMFLFLLPIGSLVWYIFSLIFIGRKMYEYRVFAQILLATQVISCFLGLLIIVNIFHLII